MAKRLAAGAIRTAMSKRRANVQKIRNVSMVEYGRGELRDVQRRITTSKTDPYARRWAPWSLATRRQRQRQPHANRGLLWKTGALLRSFRVNIRGGLVTISSNLNYARYLQEGRRNMRARRIVDLGSKLSQNRLRKILARNFRRFK